MNPGVIQIGIYDASRLLEVVEAEPKDAWRMAVTIVKQYADGATGLNDGWFRTANRVGFARGIFHCTTMRAEVSR